ncbi:GGDEF domain-containing protein [Bacillus atrophaeus]|nr:GGDEF domain-containing protein [Bacillus atrophaeus]
MARLGGDEFIIILTNTNTDTDEIDTAIKNLIEQFEMPFMIQQRELITSGIAVSPETE